ncbi:M23 family metallopeptidase [Microbacterium sp. SORGH_AS_0862]|uniref:M23 family metallopeptidase n=1 Tax=Microbacterium sp. SORGH_AS_0862 TaxID=3041789 RepID=UPI002793B91C|nr:M23 family metallopeptidase [Microbacterium sp. SORGH_AS_0862]MDQ1206774.1 murein DD-endopeptidase MepM/ murein hydrolase activator NlpD [Microbacterium sp. SORGH_AS_0862]
MSARTHARRTAAIAIALLALTAPSAVATWAPDVSAAASDADAAHSWTWPVLGRVVEPYRQPAHDYAAGHRGIDIEAGTDTVVAPDDGVILFVGVVVDRPVVTIDHGDGLVSTLEPVTTSLPPGTGVGAGEVVGTLADGGHAARGALHLGARRDGAYINPLLLLGGVPRAVLLPCC